MIPLQILSKSDKTAYEYRYKIGTSLESKEIMRNIIWQGRRVKKETKLHILQNYKITNSIIYIDENCQAIIFLINLGLELYRDMK